MLIAGFLVSAVPTGVLADEPHTALRVYGPGGPHEVLAECAALYRQSHGETILVFKGGPGTLSHRVAQDGDLYYGGAGYMLEDFDRGNPGVLDMGTVRNLHPRRLGIIVRKGNPLGIRSLEDLRREGVSVMRAELENVADFHDAPARAGGADHPVAYTGGNAFKAWLSDPTIDAWITYRSWHALLAAESDFIEIPGDDALRHTAIAITARTPHREAAERFIAFLMTPAAQRIFREHGWE